MTDPRTLYQAALISQATFALTLTILAWSDRRTRGARWLAAACAIQFAWTSIRTVAAGHVTPRSEVFSACILIYLFYCVFVGFRWFVQQRGIRSSRELFFFAALIAATFLTALIHASLAVAFGRCVAIAIGARIVWMLWYPQVRGLKTTARICATLVGLTVLLIVLNLALGLPMETSMVMTSSSVLIGVVRGVTVFLVTMLSLSFVSLFVAETNRRLHEETRTDSLTGLRNRRAMEEAASSAVSFARQSASPLALLMLDLDRFKDLNDTFGHALGDRALRAVGVVLMSETSSREITGRMGGEEFAVLLPGMNTEAAAEIAERLRSRIADLRLHETAFSATLTVSIGVSEMRSGENAWNDMLCRADDALYRAKRAGRNRVELANIGEESPQRELGVRTWRSRISLPKQML